MTQPTETAAFDGCNRKCRQAQAHTLVWGECEHAPQPEPTGSLSRVYTATDGYPSIGFDTYTVQQLADLIEPALRTVAVRLGPNALGMLQRRETVGLSGGEYADLAREAAHAIVHRYDPAVSSAGRAPATDQTTPQPPADIAAADDPTPLRWGLNDVLWGDDDSVTVMLSGPGGEPYWLELDPERATVLRQDLAGPPADQIALRDRIAAALYDHSHPGWAISFPDLDQDQRDTYLARADAVLAVLPATTDQTALRDALRRADQAEARADAMERAMESTAADALKHRGCHRELMAQCQRAERAEAAVRRMADETPAAETPACRTCELAADATEYRIPLPEDGGTTLLLRRQNLAHGAGWAVSVPGYGGGRAWTAEGWQNLISALSVDRLFCWPDAPTAVDEARRALAAGARQDGAQP